MLVPLFLGGIAAVLLVWLLWCDHKDRAEWEEIRRQRQQEETPWDTWT